MRALRPPAPHSNPRTSGNPHDRFSLNARPRHASSFQPICRAHFEFRNYHIIRRVSFGARVVAVERDARSPSQRSDHAWMLRLRSTARGCGRFVDFSPTPSQRAEWIRRHRVTCRTRSGAWPVPTSALRYAPASCLSCRPRRAELPRGPSADACSACRGSRLLSG